MKTRSKGKATASSQTTKARKTTGKRPKSAPEANATAPRLARVAKGKRPQYFSDPAIDKILWITLTLCEELSVTRDRLDTVERLLEKRRVLKVSDVEHYRPDDKTEALREQRRAVYIDRVLRAVSAELEELAGRAEAPPLEEVIAAVES
ncbi:MAG TPA: hypothetical protein PK159_05525 [Steroidobacteraceae bacterium]|nr:hypothetical protein [Steroidobacteraceae bacterium]